MTPFSLERKLPLTLTTPPAAEPVTLADAKLYLKIDTTDDDALIASLITAARARAEWHTGRALITQSWIQWLDCWPRDGIAAIPLPPLQAVASVTAYALDDSTHVIDADAYIVDCAAGRIALRTALPPFAELRRINAIAIAFTAGYGDAATDVPQQLRSAILSIVAFLYEHRGEAPAELPQDCLAALSPYRSLKL
jgi:uncharacterized phiE125 gp8 family phage protein